jgi:ABC-type multidrug transport system permease subunit
MSEGNIIYHDSPSQAKKYFNNLGFRVPRSINPADHFMSLLHIRDRLHKTEYENNVLNNAIELYKGNQHVTEDQRFKEFKPGSIEERVYKASITIEMKVCLTRAFKNSYRNDAIFKGKIIQNLLECILFSIIFQDLSTDATGVQNRNGFLFFIIIPQLFETNQDTLMSSNLYSVPMERDLFFKEKAANMYSLASYILPKLITELPVLILLTIIYSSVIYWFVNLNPHFLNFTAFSKLYIATILILARVLGNTLGLLGGILFPTTTAALVLYPAVISPLIVYAGLLVNLNSIAVSFSWMKYISVRSTQPFYYAYEVLIINEYEDQELDCRVCEDDICKECDPISDLSINPENYIRNLAILSIFPVIILLLSSLLLYIKSQIHFN